VVVVEDGGVACVVDGGSEVCGLKFEDVEVVRFVTAGADLGALANCPAQANTLAPRASPPTSVTTTREGEDTKKG
jgi:hypothetical protein